MSGDEIAHDSNLTIECLKRTIEHLKAVKGKLPRICYIQMDNCGRSTFFFSRNACEATLLGRDNKNQYVLAYLHWLVDMGVFEHIELSFLPVGHTHEVRSSTT
jgi:hypothetical protein